MKMQKFDPAFLDNMFSNLVCSTIILNGAIIAITAFIDGYNRYPQWSTILWRITIVIVIGFGIGLFLRAALRKLYKISENDIREKWIFIKLAFLIYGMVFIAAYLQIAIHGWSRYDTEYQVAGKGIEMVFPLMILIFPWSNAKISR